MVGCGLYALVLRELVFSVCEIDFVTGLDGGAYFCSPYGVSSIVYTLCVYEFVCMFGNLLRRIFQVSCALVYVAAQCIVPLYGLVFASVHCFCVFGCESLTAAFTRNK